MEEKVLFAQTNYRNQQRRFGIKTDDRRRHMYVIGKTGMGKTQMLQNMALQDIQAGRGVGVVDPHGEFADALLDYVPEERKEDVVYFNPGDYDYPIGINVLEQVDFDKRHLVASSLMGVFKKIWVDVWSARMEYILNNALLALLEYPGATLLGVNRMFADKEYRKRVQEHIQDPIVKAFWEQEYAKYTQRLEAEATAAIENKVGQFISSPLIRNIIGQKKTSFDIRRAMDEGKILIFNLAKGRIGEDNSRLIGAMIIVKLYLAAMSRVDVPEEERRDFFLYVDEFQSFATKAFEGILSEARKYRLSLVLAHQYIAQMEEEVRDAVFGNVGTLLAFRVGAADAEYLEKEFSPRFTMDDLVNLGKYNIYLKLMIDGITSPAFSAQTLPPLSLPEKSWRREVVQYSREHYARPRVEIAEEIAAWRAPLQPETGEKMSSATSAVPTGRQASSLGDGPAQLYDAVCWECGKETKVVFEPDGQRPVYCKKCRKKRERERELQRGAGGQEASEGRRRQPDIQGLRELLGGINKGEDAKKDQGAKNLNPGDEVYF